MVGARRGVEGHDVAEEGNLVAIDASGTPTMAGAYAMAYKATDSAGDEAEMNFIITIAPAPRTIRIHRGGAHTSAASGWTFGCALRLPLRAGACAEPSKPS